MGKVMPTSPALLLGVVVHWDSQEVSAQNFLSTSIQTNPDSAPEEAEFKIIFCGIPLLLEGLEVLHISIGCDNNSYNIQCITWR